MEENPACCALMGGTMTKLTAKLDGLLIRSQGRRRHMAIPWEVKNVLIPLIKQNLGSMMAIIKDNGNDNSSRALIRCLTKEVRELAYDIHDCIDQHDAGPASDHATRLLWRMERHVRVTKANGKRRGSTVLARRRTISKPITTWLSERLKGRLWLLDKMREFSARSEEALHRYKSFNPSPTELPAPKKQRNDHNHGNSSTSASATRSGESLGSWSPLPYTHVLHRRVGVHDLAINTLKGWLADGDSPKLKVVSIVGCGGVGKTTLANELYHGIGGQFESLAFVRTSQKPDVRRLLTSILSQIQPRQPPANWKVHNLIGDIRTHLQDKRSHVRASTFVDSYSWSKYGQKDIHGAKHHRSYYRCTYMKSHGCAATKQVQQTDEGQLFDITYRGNHMCVPSASLLQLEPQRTSVPLTVEIPPYPLQRRSVPLTVEIPPYPLQLEPQCSVSFSSSFPGSSSVRNPATPESQITYRTPTSDIQQNMEEDAWVDDSDYSDSDSNQRPYSHRPQEEHREETSSEESYEAAPGGTLI